MVPEDNLILADHVDSVGFHEAGDSIRNCAYSQWLGQRIAVYGPNFIWHGKLVGVSPSSIVLDDVWQVFETNSHADGNASGERMCDRQVFEKAAICNAGPTPWCEV